MILAGQYWLSSWNVANMKSFFFKYYFLRVFLLESFSPWYDDSICPNKGSMRASLGGWGGSRRSAPSALSQDSPNLEKHIQIWHSYMAGLYQGRVYTVVFSNLLFISGHFRLLTGDLRPIESSCVTPDLGNFYSNYFPLFPSKFILTTWFDEF